MPGMTPTKALQQAIQHSGGHAAVAKAMRLSRQAVYKWAKCPATRAIKLETMCGGVVSRHDLRPDVFGRRALILTEGEGAT